MALYISDTLTPIFQSKTLAITDNVFDEEQQQFQSEINKNILDAIAQGTLNGMSISGTFNVVTSNNTDYLNIFSSMSVKEMRMYLVTDSSGNLPSTNETAVTVTYDGVLSPAFLYFGKSANFGVSVGDIIVFVKLNALTNVCRIIPLNDVKAANGDFPGADGLSTVWDKQQINKISGIESTANNALPKSSQLPSRWNDNMNNALQTGVYPWCTLGRPAGSTGAYTCIVRRTSTDDGAYNTIEQTAYGREGELGKVYKRIIFEKNDGTDTQYGEWLEVTNSSGGTSDTNIDADVIELQYNNDGTYTVINSDLSTDKLYVELHFWDNLNKYGDPDKEVYLIPKCFNYSQDGSSLVSISLTWVNRFSLFNYEVFDSNAYELFTAYPHYNHITKFNLSANITIQNNGAVRDCVINGIEVLLNQYNGFREDPSLVTIQFNKINNIEYFYGTIGYLIEHKLYFDLSGYNYMITLNSDGSFADYDMTSISDYISSDMIKAKSITASRLAPDVTTMIDERIVNADEEDLTCVQQVLNDKTYKVLQLKDREFVESKGMGYVILRQDKTFAEQVTKANTIYEIRYDFDLDSININLPNNTTLKFNGGVLSNGTLTGDTTIIDANNTDKIFDNISLEGIWNIGKLYPQWFGAKGDSKTDDTDAIQKTIVEGYNIKKKVYIPSGEYIITRALFVFDGITLKGDGIYNSILRTPFSKSDKAKEYSDRDKQAYNTATNPSSVPVLDLIEGHNRFYLGDGSVGYFDGDRDTNPDHPLYYPNDGSDSWSEWDSLRTKVNSKGLWIGATGRENYAEGLIKCSQNPEIYHPTKGQSGYKHKYPQGRVHTGVRNVTISGLKIQTNSPDRGKDTAINFRYQASQIPSNIRETYDSSVLNIYISNMYLYSLGGSGITLTRAVDTTIVNCYIHQVAGRGIYVDGVTSVNISGCYANSCADSGYNLKGVNYSSLNATAADGCGVGYKLNNCKGVTLVSCGAEATRFIPVEEGEETIYKGRAYDIDNCNGVSLISCYAMASRPRLYIDSTDEDAEFYNSEWNQSRFVLVRGSINIDINQCYFKSFGRIRSNAYRNDNNEKVNKNEGTYDPTSYGSRYWQVQNYLIGSIFEIIGESTSVRINGNSDIQSFIKEQEIRWGNVDILDPGIVPNPLVSYGVDTANKTISGDDGNGGWTINGTPIDIATFEGMFPINGNSQYGKRNYFWEWRDSLILVRKNTDDSLKDAHPNNYYGYNEFYTTPIDWNNVDEESLNKFKIDIVDDYSDTSFIDGDKNLFTYGNFAYEDSESYTFKPRVTTPIPAIVKYKEEGARTTINAETLTNISLRIRKAALGVIGNNIDSSSQLPNLVLGLQTKQKKSDLGDSPVMAIEDKNGTGLLEVYANNKLLGIGNKKIISLDSNNYNNIPLLELDASQETVINTINDLINRLINHGLMDAQEDINNDVAFSEVTVLSTTDSAFEIQFTIQKGVDSVYNVGVAYSSSNTEPTKSNNSVTATLVEGYTYTASIPRSTTNPSRYIRLYCTETPTDGERYRVYSKTTYLQ